MTPIEAAYFAGLIDGEGCVSVRESKGVVNKAGYLCSPTFSTRVNVTNTSERMIAWIREHVGGRIFLKCRAGEGRATRDCYRWETSAGRAISVLRDVLPYLVIKRDQADMVLHLKNIFMRRDPEVSHHAPTRLTEGELAERRRIVEDLKLAKRTQGALVVPESPKHEITASPIEWAYLAGMFDGEGCVRASESKPGKRNKSPRFQVHVQITNTSEKLIVWMLERFGGNLQLVHAPGYGKSTRNCWAVLWTTAKGEALLRGMYPYLTTKKAQADLAFKLRTLTRSKHPRNGGFAPGQLLDAGSISARRELVQALRHAKTIQ